MLLPEKPEGKFWLKDFDEKGVERELISFEAVGDNWFLRSNKIASILDVDNTILKSVQVRPMSFLNIQIKGIKDRVVLFTEPISTDRSHFYKFVVQKGHTWKIGRDDTNEIVFDNEFVSGYHAALSYDGTNWAINDKNSTNGTYYLRFGGNGLFWTSNKCMYKFSVTQIISVSNVSIPSKKTIVAGRKIKLPASISPENASDKTVTWSSSDSDIVTVDSKGNVKGINSGKAIITAKSNDNDQAYAECVVIVKPKKPSVGKISSYRYGKKKRHVYFSVNSKVRYIGYQTKWSKSKKMTKAKTTKKTDKYLKKGKYYFQMRTYVEIDGKKYYSAWSKVKKVKVK